MRKKIQKFDQNISKYAKPFKKESFDFVEKLLKKHKIKTVLDIGCASGDFVNSLSRTIKAVGIDKSKELINLAKQRKGPTDRKFYCLNALNKKSKTYKKLLNQAEAITILGTLQTFNDFQPFMDIILKSKAKLIIIHAPFNDDPIDVQIFHRDLSQGETEFQSAYNIHSKETLANFFKKYKIKKFYFLPFTMKKNLKKDKKYPLRNYHLFSRNGQKFTVNGARIIFNESMLVIEK